MVLWAAVLWRASPAGAQVELPKTDRNLPILIAADAASQWTQGVYEVWLLQGNCRVQQGMDCARANDAVVWIERSSAPGGQPSKVIAYLEGAVSVDFSRDKARARLEDRAWLGRFETVGRVEVQAAQTHPPPAELPPIYHRGMARRTLIVDGSVRRTQYHQFTASAAAPAVAAPGTRRIRLFARSDVPVQARWDVDPVTRRATAIIEAGVNMIVDGLPEVGSLDVSADRLVIWTIGVFEPNVQGETLQTHDIPLEVYLEGNIVFRQGDRVIYADRMYYDVNNRIGIVLGAELLTPVPNYEGLLRLRTAILRQTGQDRFFAEDSFLTSSRLGVPGYRLQVGQTYFEDNQVPVVDPRTGTPVVDPNTGEPLLEHRRLAIGRNNVLFLGPLPIFYWPVIATDLNEPTTYVRRVRIKNDRIFGTQVLTNWNGYQVLGISNPPAGTDLDVSLDFLSDRGLGHGGSFTYSREGFLGLPGPTSGLADFWGIPDHGTDDLGLDRPSLQPEKKYRDRLFWQHRQLLPNDFQLSAQTIWISDRNFLEQYFEREWDEVLNEDTAYLELKQSRDNWSWSIVTSPRINSFFTQTEWLPRLDHFWLGQPLARDVFTWYEHTTVGYGQFRVAEPPKDPNDRPFVYLPWEALPPYTPGTPVRRAGERLITRQEIDWPLQLGVFKVVPFVLGELAHWGEDLQTGDDLQRAYGEAGLRASIPFWSVNPAVESTLWNVHGLAHKIVFDATFSWAESNRDLGELPLYDPLDDDPVEAFRRRFAMNTFGGTIPAAFDERFYALRNGLQDWVASPSMEIADDLMAVRLGMRHRWQTKRGSPGAQRIIDWITLDTELAFFPDKNRDNFGEALGLLDYDFRWHVGDRLTLLSDGIFDFFDQGQKAITVGAILNRPPRGSLYFGLHYLDGPIRNTILAMSYTYRMSPKWISSFGMSVDVAGQGNIGQNFSITRIGEAFLISLGGSFDASRDNFGIQLAVEPRFLPRGRLGQVSGARVPVAGAMGLE